jgi:hypothetical protein
MANSPHLEGITDPLEVLKVAVAHPILLCSEPPLTFYPLEELGWAIYRGGRWCITQEGMAMLEPDIRESSESTKIPLTDFFLL